MTARGPSPPDGAADGFRRPPTDRPAPDVAFDGARLPPPRSLILEVSTRAVFHAAAVFAVWLLAAGHNQPGGGFVGGLTISAALVLTYTTGGSQALRRALPARPLSILGSGMLVAQAAAAVPLAFGGSVLESASVTVSVPLFGSVKVLSTLFFDTGVMLIVVGLVAKALDTLGSVDPHDVDADRPEEAEAP